MCPMTCFRSQPIKTDNTKYCLPNILCTSLHALRGSSMLLPVPAAPICKDVKEYEMQSFWSEWIFEKVQQKTRKEGKRENPRWRCRTCWMTGRQSSPHPSVFLDHSATFWPSYNPNKGANECGYSGNAPKLPSIFRKLPPAVRDLYFLNSCVFLCWFNILLLNAALLSCSKSQPHTISSIHKGNYLFIIHLFIHYLSRLSFHLRPKTVRRVEVESWAKYGNAKKLKKKNKIFTVDADQRGKLGCNVAWMCWMLTSGILLMQRSTWRDSVSADFWPLLPLLPLSQTRFKSSRSARVAPTPA